MASTATHDLETHLDQFGLNAFRPGQKEVITAVLERRDSLCIMPTGGGKSLCYQLPAVCREGVTLVVSPLIALMKDQVDGLVAQGMRATYVNSSLVPAEQRQRLAGVARGEYDLVYVAPERLRNPGFLEAIRNVSLQLLAVDEAHCISEWGHDFRPDYAKLGQFRERLGRPQTIALTATATPDVRADVIRQLDLRDPQVLVTGFARPNLRFEVFDPRSTPEKNQRLLDVVREADGGGIVYASTRRRCEELSVLMADELGRPVGVYHAGLLAEQRREVQEDFMRGKVNVIVATNAFGMGIDKADLRFVVHYNMPGSLEAYYQEAGRAGRDGLPSRCVLLFHYADRYLQEFFIENSYPSRDVVKRVYDYLRKHEDDPIELSQQDIKERLDLPVGAEGVGACERMLEKCQALERLEPQQNMASVKIESDLPTLVDLLPKNAKLQRKALRAIERVVEDRRYEWVYLSPQQIAATNQIERESFARALRELTALPVLDYVPPFRGRAIHMLQRKRPFPKLELDFEELERRKQAELEKLERVIRYARSSRCRQSEILDYFGDQGHALCGACDNCSPQPRTERQPAPAGQLSEEAEQEAVRIVLSGAARARGRVGKQLLAKMLCGSQSAQVSRLRLHELSTFGLLKDLKQREALEIIDGLLSKGLLEQLERQQRRPVIRLTDTGTRVMRGEAPLNGSLSLSSEVCWKLQARFRLAARRQVSRSDKPTAPSSAERSLPTSQSESVVPPPHVAAVDSHEDQDQANRPNHYWTWRLFADDYDMQQCLQIRGIDEETALDHLLRASEDGLDVRLEWVLAPEQLEVLAKTVGRGTPRRLRPLLEELPSSIHHEHLQLYIRCRDGGRRERAAEQG